MSSASEATALAVKLGVQRLRLHGFTGRAPTLSRQGIEGSVHGANFQRVNAGVTGRRPGFTVNLDLLPSAVRRAWRAAGLAEAEAPNSGGFALGLHTRLQPPGPAALVERWWHPSTPAEAEQAAGEVDEAFRYDGERWFEGASTLAGARALLITTVLPDLLVLGAMELDELGAVSPEIKTRLARWRGDALVEWLLAS